MTTSNSHNKSILLFKQHACSIQSLEDLGFRFVSEERIPATKAAPESHKICFSNKKNRSIDLIFYPLPNDQGIILAYINNLDEKQVINLKDWLKKHNHLPSDNSFKLASYSGDTNDRWIGLRNFLNDAFRLTPLSKILLGDTWEDIPFDWAGIK